MKLSHLEHADRLRLMKFVCAFAWADLEIADQERSFITKMAKQLHLGGDDHKQVKAWMELPPKVEELDPNVHVVQSHSTSGVITSPTILRPLLFEVPSSAAFGASAAWLPSPLVATLRFGGIFRSSACFSVM